MKLSLFLLSAAAMVNAATGEGLLTAEDDIAVVELETAANYVILAKSGISTVPNSPINGNIAVSPIGADAITGFGLIMDSSEQFSISPQVNNGGHVFAKSYGGATETALTTAVSDMQTAYDDAAGRSSNDEDKENLNSGDLGGLTLVPGVYTFGTNVLITNDVTFSGAGVYIIRTTGSVVQDANKNVILADGALAENIFWQVAGEVKVNAGGHMEGVLLVSTAVHFITGSTLNGRILAQTAVTLQKASITEMPVRSP
jgi:hypothetical protein